MGVKLWYVELWKASLNGEPEHDLTVTRMFIENASYGIGLDSFESDLDNVGPFWWEWELPKGRLLEPSWVSLNEPKLRKHPSWWQITRHGWLNWRQPFSVWYSVLVWQEYEYSRQENMYAAAALAMGIETDWYNPTYTILEVYENLSAELDLIAKEALWELGRDLTAEGKESHLLAENWEGAPFQAAYDYRQYANCLIDHRIGLLHHPRSY